MNKRFIIVLIAFMNMIVPLSLDMYLPAVPHMTAAFNTTESTVNLTLVGFFFFMAIGTLIFGRCRTNTAAADCSSRARSFTRSSAQLARSPRASGCSSSRACCRRSALVAWSRSPQR